MANSSKSFQFYTNISQSLYIISAQVPDQSNNANCQPSFQSYVSEEGAFPNPSIMKQISSPAFCQAQYWQQRTQRSQECLSKGMALTDTTFQLSELPKLDHLPMNHSPQDFITLPPQPATKDTVFKIENKRKSTRYLWVEDRQNKFSEVVERLGLAEVTAAEILKGMNDPELDYGKVNSHLQHERDKVAMKSKTTDQDVGITSRKKRKIKNESSSDHSRLWKHDLQQKFIGAGEKKVGGVKHATANEILKEMAVPLLTRHQVNSHLQNYKKKTV